MGQYLLIESNNDNTSLIDLQNLVKSIDGMYRNTKGSFSNFISISKNKFGISSSKDVSTKIPKWLKMSEYAAVGTAFLAFVFKAIDSAKLFFETFSKSFQAIDGYHTFGNRIGYLGVVVICVFLSYVMIKVWKLVKNQETNAKTESTYTQNSYKNIINETSNITKNINRFIESTYIMESETIINKFNTMLKKASDMCVKIFVWLKEKFKTGVAWVKKHPYITLTLLITIGFVFYAKFGKTTANGATIAKEVNTFKDEIQLISSVSPEEAVDILSKMDQEKQVKIIRLLRKYKPEYFGKLLQHARMQMNLINYGNEVQKTFATDSKLHKTIMTGIEDIQKSYVSKMQ